MIKKTVTCKKCGTEYVIYVDKQDNAYFDFRCPECAEYYSK